MQLFKRLLLSAFPDSFVNNPINPAFMFVSFISSKDFFSIINRRIVENYKLNLFDLSMDVFEFRFGLGDTSNMDPSVLDEYYAYLAAANFNGYKFYNVANTANALVIAAALYLTEAFKDEEPEIFIDCLYAFYLMSFLFASKIKVFPGNSLQEDFNWFVDLFFDFYQVVLSQLKHKYSQVRFAKLKKKLLSQLEVFFLMFHYYRRLHQLFDAPVSDQEYFRRLFGDEFSASQRAFLTTYETTKFSTQMNLLEEEILFEVAPTDIHLKYLFLEHNPHDIIATLISSIYDKKLLDKKLSLLIKKPETLDFILDYLTNPVNFKKGYFEGMQKYLSVLFRGEEIEDEFDELMSLIGDDLDTLKKIQIPPRIKKESRTVEQLLNFYVTYLGGLSIEKSDSFFLRQFKPQLLKDFMTLLPEKEKLSPASLRLYGLQQFFYSKNTFFYAYVNKQIRSSKEKFSVPLKTSQQTIDSNDFSLYLFEQLGAITLLQDLNPKITSLYINNHTLLAWFQKKFSKSISEQLKQPSQSFLLSYYEDFFSCIGKQKDLFSLLHAHLGKQDIVRLKNSLYSLEYRLSVSFFSQLPVKVLQSMYSRGALLLLYGSLRELLFGFCFYYYALSTGLKDDQRSVSLPLLKQLFLLEMIGIDPSLYPVVSDLLDALIKEFDLMFSLLSTLDDNPKFFELLVYNWKDFISHKEQLSTSSFSVEDILWLRGVFKHISYYNKRYVVPKT